VQHNQLLIATAIAMERMLQIRNLGPILAENCAFRLPKSRASFVTAPRQKFLKKTKLHETPKN
jgi:hypothetical protein